MLNGAKTKKRSSSHWSGSKTSNSSTAAIFLALHAFQQVRHQVRHVNYWSTINVRSRWWRHQQVCAVVVRDSSTTHSRCESSSPFYRYTVVARLLSASSAWWGFPTATDRQRIDASLGRSTKCYVRNFRPSFNIDEYCGAANEKLREAIFLNLIRTLYCIHHLYSRITKVHAVLGRGLKLELNLNHLTDSHLKHISSK